MCPSIARCLGVVFLLVGCRSAASPELPEEPLTGFSVVQAGPDCAPWDGAAVTILFSAGSGDPDSLRAPYLRVSLWKGLDALVGATWRWPIAEQVGGASLCLTDQDCRAATAGVVRLEAVGADSVVAGRLRLDFPDRPTMAGSFRATWRPRVALCG